MSEGSPTEEFGPYTVYEQLGIGGMAQVHRAIATGSEAPRSVALKRMLSHIASSQDMVKSFVREARLASYLRHPNVASTYDVGRVGDVYFIVMELITGRNLREVLRHCGATTGPVPVPVALNILNQVCDALDYAHNLCDEHGQPLQIIHRDVSPSNVIVSDSGLVKLIDFGIAKASGAGMQTMSGTLKGKFAYMAPEYIAGRIDARADLFAVGVIAHELLTNRPLFAGRDDIDTLTRVRDMKIAPPSKTNPHVPPEIDDVVMTALSRDPDRRWQHATALRSALTTLTQRLGLVVTNSQVVQWLDWAFTQQRKPRRTAEPDTETDAAPLGGQPAAVRRAARVFDPGSLSQKITRIEGHGNAALALEEPEIEIEIGASVTVQPYLLPARAAAAVPEPIAARSDPSRPQGPISPNITASGMGAPGARAASHPGRLASASPSPPLGQHAVPRHAHAAPSGPVPSALPGRAPSVSGPHMRPSAQSIPLVPLAPGAPASPATGTPSAAIGTLPIPTQPGPAPQPAMPSFNSAPFSAPRGGTPSQPFPLVDPARCAVVAREFEQRATASSRTMAPVARPGRAWLVLTVWVVVAAVLAALAVYFVVPLLT